MTNDLTREQFLVLEWLSRDDRNLLGECQGSALDALVAAGFAKIDPPPPGRSVEYSNVALTDAGWIRFQRGQEGLD